MRDTVKNGKGDSPRNCFSEEYRNNFDNIFRKNKDLEFKNCVDELEKATKRVSKNIELIRKQISDRIDDCRINGKNFDGCSKEELDALVEFYTPIFENIKK